MLSRSAWAGSQRTPQISTKQLNQNEIEKKIAFKEVVLVQQMQSLKANKQTDKQKILKADQWTVSLRQNEYPGEK